MAIELFVNGTLMRGLGLHKNLQGGVFGWVTDSNKFTNAIKDGFSV